MPSSNLLAFDELNIGLCSDDFDAIEPALEYSPKTNPSVMKVSSQFRPRVFRASDLS